MKFTKIYIFFSGDKNLLKVEKMYLFRFCRYDWLLYFNDFLRMI